MKIRKPFWAIVLATLILSSPLQALAVVTPTVDTALTNEAAPSQEMPKPLQGILAVIAIALVIIIGVPLLNAVGQGAMELLKLVFTEEFFLGLIILTTGLIVFSIATGS